MDGMGFSYCTWEAWGGTVSNAATEVIQGNDILLLQIDEDGRVDTFRKSPRRVDGVFEVCNPLSHI
jgi:hypothetical protein